MSGLTAHFFPRPVGPVPTDDVHRWLPYPLAEREVRMFTNPWKRLGAPWRAVRVEGGFLLYAHQHVADPANGRSRWCCRPTARADAPAAPRAAALA